MSNENPNNTRGWRNKLDELEDLPGSAFNKDVAWDKLYGRLRGNKGNKKMLWYWIAAACLLAGLLITLLNYDKNTSQPVNKETVMKQQLKEIKKSVLKVEEVNKNESDNNAGLIKNKIVTTSNKPIKRNRRITPTEVATTKIHPDDVIISYPEKEPIVKPVQIINTNPATALLPQRKKLNVVHINELGDPVESSDITRIADMHSFQLKFGNGEVLSNSPIASKPSGLIILKTKPSSN